MNVPDAFPVESKCLKTFNSPACPDVSRKNDDVVLKNVTRPSFSEASLRKYDDETTDPIESFRSQPKETFHLDPSNKPGASISSDIERIGDDPVFPGRMYRSNFGEMDDETANR